MREFMGMIRRSVPFEDHLRLYPAWIHFLDREAIQEFRDQSVGVPGMFLISGETCLSEDCFMRFYVFSMATVRYLVHVIRETGGKTLEYYEEYHHLRRILLKDCCRRVGKYGYYVLREDVGRMMVTIRRLNVVINRLLPRLKMPLLSYREYRIRSLFAKLREQWQLTGNRWWEPLGVDETDYEAIYREFRRHLRVNQFRFCEHRIEWVKTEGWGVVNAELFCFRGSKAFQEAVEVAFSDYLEKKGMSVSTLLDLDEYEKWQKENETVGDMEYLSTYLSDLWRIGCEEEVDSMEKR